MSSSGTNGLPPLRRRLPEGAPADEDDAAAPAPEEVDPTVDAAVDDILVDDMHCFDCDVRLGGDGSAPWMSASYGIHICLNCAGVHRSLGVHISFVRSIALDTLTDREQRSLDVGGNNAFATFLTHPERGVPRRVWLALPLQTRYHTPAADLYRRQLKASIDAILGARSDGPGSGGGTSAAGSSSSSSALSMDPNVRPPPPTVATAANAPPKWTANREAPRCQLCKAEFNLLKWRHHCRKCGRCVCDECSPSASWQPLPQFFASDDPARCCKLCVAPTRPMVGM